MKVATGRVVAGKVVVEGEPLPEGAVVTVVASAGEAVFDLTPEEEAILLASVAQADAGRTRPAADVISDLPEA